ncbi:MAG: ATP-binding protein [Myxococcota bacterium]|nr:ATP-binding protein [Myxococcota bacterium]
MRTRRDPVLLVGALLVLAVTLHGLLSAAAWTGRPFAGFLLLENHVVPSAGLAHWPGTAGGEIYQRELVSIDGRLLEDPAQLQRHARSLPVGTPVTYRFGHGEDAMERVIETRLFKRSDFLLLFGSFLFCGLGLTGVALTIRFLRPHDPVGRGSSISLWLIGMWALTAMDLYGPHRGFRVHAFFECFIWAGTLHLALVFPAPRSLARRFPGLIPLCYAAAAPLALWNQVGLFDPATYVLTHRIATSAFGIAAVALIAAQVYTFVRPPSFDARQRVKVMALGSVAALAPQVLLSIASAASGGQAPENLMGWSGIFFPLAVAYSVLRSDLLRVDVILRRTVAYTVLTGLVAIGYLAALAAIGPAFRAFGITDSATSALSLSTLLVLVVLPLRDGVQSMVDRIFFRTQFDYRRLVGETSAAMATLTELPVLAAHLEEVVKRALAPESLTLKLAAPQQGSIPLDEVPWHGSDARRTSPDAWIIELPGDGLGVAFVAQGRLVAAMQLGRPLSGRFYTGDDRRFLSTLANQGAIAIQNSLALLSLRELNRTLESRVVERTAELSEALDELRETQQQMVHQEKMASLGQLVAGVAHEINNPLNFIHGNLSLLREYVDTLTRTLTRYGEVAAGKEPELATIREELDVDFVLDDLQSLFAGCEEGVSRTTTIVKDLRTFSRLESGRPTEVDLSAVIDATLNLLRGKLTGIEVEREEEDVPLIEGLEGQLDQVLLNLVANAADAVGDRGTIRIRLRAEGKGAREGVVLEIEDDGCGIAPEARERIFEPFFTTKEVGQGTGLGLAISYGVVARHGGEIGVESEPGRGTCFRIRLPRVFPRTEDGGA